MSNFAACWQLATPLSSSGMGCTQLIYLGRVTRPQARVAIATVLKMESWCDERGATERGCARTVDASSIRVRCDGSRADLDAPVSGERTPPIRVEGRGGFVTAPRIRCTTCRAARRGRRVRPGDTRAVQCESRVLTGI